MSDKPTVSIAMPNLLGLLFIALKLTGYITWSWVWVLAPYWIPLVFIAIFLSFWVALVLLGQRPNVTIKRKK